MMVKEFDTLQSLEAAGRAADTPGNMSSFRKSGIDLLNEANQVLDHCKDLPEALEKILDSLRIHAGMFASWVRFKGTFAEEMGEVVFLSDIDREVLPLEFIEIQENKVHSSGELVVTVLNDLDANVIPNEDPGRKKPYILSVPIGFGRQQIGVLSIVKFFRSPKQPRLDGTLLTLVASTIAKVAIIHQSDSTYNPKIVAGHKDKQQAHAFRPASIMGNSKAIRLVFDSVGQVVKSDTTTLILGESGVGKELVASAIHNYSDRAKKPFIKINCAALPESLLESELFGHERGAFTGAVQQKKGRFELADGGTIFLDEIGDITHTTQVKLLRVLQEKEFERLGGVHSLKTDVRIVAATNRNLEAMIEAGDFRRDLYYRLNVFPIYVPALRERKTDIVLLADHFVKKYSDSMNKDIRRISTPAIDMLMSYHWPGNVRELENCIERATLLSTDGVVHSHHLPPSLQTADTNSHQVETLRSTLESLEREMIEDALRTSGGNMAKAARALGLTERVMGLRAKKYGLDSKNYRG